MSNPFTFEALPAPVAWIGRYNRIPGKEPTFKARLDGSALAYWSPWKSEEWLSSLFVPCPAVRQLTAAVNQAKEQYVGSPGGSFQINEFGQVICPVGSEGQRYWVGTVGGVPRFQDPRDSAKTFDLQESDKSQPGKPWDRPYLGMKFNLDANDSVYFKQDEGDTRTKLRLKLPAPELIRRLRQVRGDGTTMRFIVNLHGVVLTKVGVSNQPVFVGHIQPGHWFPNYP